MYDCPPRYIAYGTAGFRDKADVLPTVVYRVGLVAALRSRALNGQYVGVMVTASHNPPPDNGAKLIDPYGDMLDQAWEPRVAAIANSGSVEECKNLVEQAYTELNIPRNSKANVVFGRDTRESGPELIKALSDGLRDAGAHITDLGLVTTPQVHYYVRAINTVGANPRNLEPYGEPSETGYYQKLANAFASVHSGSPLNVVVDCANGVGALKLKSLQPFVSEHLKFTIVNSECDKPDLLNHECGADYVKTQQRLPSGISSEIGGLCASFDGDADRVVFYYADTTGFHLLDGDKIATLLAWHFQTTASQSGVDLNIGVVQTAYANGASTEYIEKELKLPVVCTPTGVKHLHHAAQAFDIGVYFEANGHGTVLFSTEAVSKLRKANTSAAKSLLAYNELINQTVGDSISDLLAVLAVVSSANLSPANWDLKYSDLPNLLLKATVRDRTEFVTTDAERRLVQPAQLQSRIDELVSQIPRSRAFVRASGTENVVRIYAEAETREAAVKLGETIQQAIAGL